MLFMHDIEEAQWKNFEHMYKQHALMTESYFAKLNKSAAFRESIGDIVIWLKVNLSV